MDPIETWIDDLARLAMRGHIGLAHSLAEERRGSNPFAAYLAHAMIAAAVNDRQALSGYARTAAAVAPDHPLVAQALAMMHLTEGELELAETEARRAVALAPGPRSQSGLARVLMAAGKRSEAEATLQTLVRGHDDAEARLDLGALRDQQGDHMGALAHYARAFALAPTDSRALQRAMQMYREAAWPIGVAMLTRVTRGGAHPPDVYYLLDMLALSALRLIDEEPLRELLGISDGVVDSARAIGKALSPAAQLRLVRTLIDTSRDADARAVCDAVEAEASLPQDVAELAFCQAILLQRAGKIDDAIVHNERAVDAHEAHWEAATNGASLLLARRDKASLERATRLIERVPLVLRRLHAPLSFNEALILEARGRHEAAAALIIHLGEAPLGELEEPVKRVRERLVRTTA